jgi:PAS domain S-box-containing protein
MLSGMASDPHLAGSERRFTLLVQAVEDYAIFMLDPTGHILTWNEGAKRAKGYTEDEIVGQHFSVFYTEPDRESRFPDHELEVATRVGRFEDEGWRVRKDGSRFWANVVITALRNPDGSLEGFAKVTRDLTERKRATEQMAEMRAQIERHELSLRRAGELNDNIVQGLALAKYALEQEDTAKAAEAVAHTLEETRRIVSSLLADAGVRPGDLRRAEAARPSRPDA